MPVVIDFDRDNIVRLLYGLQDVGDVTIIPEKYMSQTNFEATVDQCFVQIKYKAFSPYMM
jgi:hypothetical protein